MENHTKMKIMEYIYILSFFEIVFLRRYGEFEIRQASCHAPYSSLYVTHTDNDRSITMPTDECTTTQVFISKEHQANHMIDIHFPTL